MDGQRQALRKPQAAAVNQLERDAVAPQRDVGEQPDDLFAGQHHRQLLMVLGADLGSFAPNGYGLYDMSGNVWEWCWDWYGGYSSSPETDPRGPSSGSARVVRGAGWSSYAPGCCVANRGSGGPSGNDYGDGGFRPARSSVP